MFFSESSSTESYTLSLHDALPILLMHARRDRTGRLTMRIHGDVDGAPEQPQLLRSEEHTSELQSRGHLVCRLLREKKKARRKARPPRTRMRQTANSLPRTMQQTEW